MSEISCKMSQVEFHKKHPTLHSVHNEAPHCTQDIDGYSHQPPEKIWSTISSSEDFCHLKLAQWIVFWLLKPSYMEMTGPFLSINVDIFNMWKKYSPNSTWHLKWNYFCWIWQLVLSRNTKYVLKRFYGKCSCVSVFGEKVNKLQLYTSQEW